MRTFSALTALIVALSFTGLGRGQAAGKPVELQLIVTPETVAIGDEAEVEVVLKIARPWYIYGTAAGLGGQQPLRLELSLPTGIEAVGEWQWPSGKGKGSDKQLLGTKTLRHRIRVTTAQRDAAIHVMVGYQACNEEFCAAPEMARLSGKISTRAGGSSPADADWAVIEKQVYGPAGGYASSAEEAESLSKQKGFRPGIEFGDRKLQQASALAAAFYDAYPGDQRRAEALNRFLVTPPYFIKEYPPEFDARFKNYLGYRRALPVDDEAMTTWRRNGDAMAADTLNSSTATLEEKEQVGWWLFLRDWHINAFRTQLRLPADWPAQDALFDTHVENYLMLDKILGTRAASYLEGKNRIARALAEMKADGPGQLCERWLKSPSPGVRQVAAAYLETTRAATGDQAAKNPFEVIQFTALDGREVNLPKMKGRVVYIDIWAMWCAPCVQDLPELKAVHDKYHAQGFEMIGINCDPGSQKEALKEFLRKHGYTWPQHFDGNGPANRFAKLFDVHTWPTTFLIGKDGQVIAKDIRGKPLEPAIRKALGLDP